MSALYEIIYRASGTSLLEVALNHTIKMIFNTIILSYTFGHTYGCFTIIHMMISFN